jgi:hypothetical protein
MPAHLLMNLSKHVSASWVSQDEEHHFADEFEVS